MKSNIRCFDSRVENTIESLFEKIKSKEKMLKLQEQMIKLRTAEIEKLKIKLYNNALLDLRNQPEPNSTLKMNK
ncbi:MAG: hypothetical protein GY707_14180 [Desulfobacteraceae bacterium]|nr:hypothetical protein [Desulfobacteraceae bacterium]